MHQYDIVLDVTVMNRTGDSVLLSTVGSAECCHCGTRSHQMVNAQPHVFCCGAWELPWQLLD